MKPVIMIAQRIGGENGGPFVSHKRIMESRLKEKYEFVPLMVPRARVLLTPWGMLRLSRTIRRARPAAVQLAGLQLEGFLPMLACRLAGVRTVLAVHGSLMESEAIRGISRRLYGFAERMTVRMADTVFGVSDYVSSWKVCRRAKRYCGTIYNLIDWNAAPSRRDLRGELGIADDAPVVVSTGRITQEKGYADLWKAIRRSKHGRKMHFIIAGDGPYREQMLREVEAEGYSGNVHLLGYMPDVTPVLEAADMFVICTHHETLCISILEACKHRLPVVATDVGGIPEIVEHGKGGYLVSAGDADGFAAAMDRLADDPRLREEMGAAAYDRLCKVFGEEAILGKLDALYERFAG